MMVVGITGGIGSGKSTVLKLFKELGNIATYIADKEAKDLMNTSKVIQEKLVLEFGEEVYLNNKLNRPFLANIVFKNKEKLAVLNEIVHPVVYNHLENFIKNNIDKDYILYENAILFENGSDVFCDKIITVTAPEEVKINRVISRDKTSEKEVRNRMKNQWKDSKKILQSNYIICNVSLEETKGKVLKIHNKLTQNLL
ncbi:dephospho-CoA kinase [Tenacibaculum sp. K20-16]|nr:dephospho-CoA kinase [Tenacibaculum sp. 1_MG-2023]MCH3883232.1 dephospho-CoA kinase [Tenacibaculum aquimarinum]MDO6600924.1 dephospho-CoA kinase [Tenacibaculum sp. 1_MG-2023]